MKKLLSFVLVLAMIMGCVSVAFAGTTKSKNSIYYLPIGDSFSNGYHFEELENDPECKKIYPILFGQYLKEEAGYDTVTVSSVLLRNGLRANDVLAYLGKSEYKDGLTDYWQPSTQEDSQECIKAVQDANIISIKLGYNNFVSYIRLAIQKDLELDPEEYGSLDYSQGTVDKLLTKEQKEMLKVVRTDLTEIVNSTIPEEIISAIKDGTVSFLDTPVGAYYTVEDYINIASYAILGACIDYDNMLAEIYRLNPSVDVYVMELDNTLDDITLTYQLDDNEIEIPLGKIAGSVIDLFNTYYAVLSKYSDKTFYVKSEENPETFAEKVVSDSAFAATFTTQFIGQEAPENIDIVKNVQKYLAVSDFSLNDMIDGFSNLSDIASLFSSDKITNLLTGDFSKVSEMDKFIVKVYIMVFAFYGAGCHPSVEGHVTMAQALEEAYEEHRVLDEAVVYHFIIKMIPEDAVKFMYSKTIEEVKASIELYNKQYAYVKQFCDKIYETINNPTVVTILPETNMVKVSSSTKLVTPKTVVSTIKNRVNTVLGKLFK